jgi:hypothetical protein
MISKFHVMALLQTARAKVLGEDIKRAKIFGLKKAFFYLMPKVIKEDVSELDYDQVIKSAFGSGYQQAWNDAQKIVGIMGQQILLSHRDFYQIVYQLRVDQLKEKWNKPSRSEYAYAYAHDINHRKKSPK